MIFLLCFLPFLPLFLSLFSGFWGSYEPLTLIDRTRLIRLFLLFFIQAKKDGIPVPTLFILSFVPAFIHTISTGISELCFDFARGLFCGTGVYYWVTPPLTSRQHTQHASNAGTYPLAGFPVCDSRHPLKCEDRVLV